jgi:hypothetical protein
MGCVAFLPQSHNLSFSRSGIDDLAIGDQQCAAGGQDSQPRGKSRVWIDKRPDQMPADDYIVVVVGLHGISASPRGIARAIAISMIGPF